MFRFAFSALDFLPDSSQKSNESALAGIGGFLLFYGVRSHFSALIIAAVLFCLWRWHKNRSYYRQIIDIPTSTIAAAPQGYVEICGRGELLNDVPIVSPLTKLPCLWYSYRVERINGNQRSCLDSGFSRNPFLISDGEHRIIVVPEGAKVYSKHTQTWQRDDQHYTETVLLKDEDIYVLGDYVHALIDSDALSTEKQASALLQEMKLDQDQLKVQFDSNKDGVIDGEEWSAAREFATQQVLLGNAEAHIPNHQFIRKPTQNQLFLIANYSAKQLAKKFRNWSWLYLGLFFVALIISRI